MRFTAAAWKTGSFSQPMKLRPSRLQATPVVPEPAKRFLGGVLGQGQSRPDRGKVKSETRASMRLGVRWVAERYPHALVWKRGQTVGREAVAEEQVVITHAAPPSKTSASTAH
jgi:hypothetical protein